MKLFSLSILNAVISFYIMMFIVIISVLFLDMPYLSVLGAPFFLIAILGIRFTPKKKGETRTTQEHSELSSAVHPM